MGQQPTHRSGVDIFKQLLRYSLPYWKIMLLAVIGMLLYAGTETGFAILMKPMLDGSFVEQDPDMIRLIPIAIIVLFIFRGLSHFLSEYCMDWVAGQVTKELRGEIFNHVLYLPSSRFDTTPTGQLLSTITYRTGQMSKAATDALTIMIRDTFTIIGLLAWMFYLNWMLSSILLIAAPLVAGVVAYVTKRFRKISRRIHDAMADVTEQAEASINAQRIIKIFGGQAHEARNFDYYNEKNRRMTLRKMSLKHASNPIIQLIAATALALIIYLATLEPMLEQVTVGTFVSFIVAMMMLLSPLRRITTVNAVLQRAIAAGEVLFDFLEEPAEPDTGTRRLKRAEGVVEYDDVWFSYDSAKGPVLKGVSLKADPGQRLALVGRSGSGKSTFVNLLPRFYDVESGRILLDGVDIREYRLQDLRRQISLVGQEVTLFNDTIANNIAYARLGEDVSRQDIEQAAQVAHAMEFIQRMPRGLDTNVGEKGHLLSGGQRQRIAIARALLRDAPILILDEATSSLDAESERYIQTALERLMRNRTTFIIAHRLSTVEQADQILVLHDGAIVESGCHEDLIRQGGHYASLYQVQFDEVAAG